MPVFKSNLFVAFIMLFSFILKAQDGSITGKVTDGSTGNAIAYASVFLGNATKSAQTNTDGSFTLTGIQPGQYDLVVSYVGYKIFSQKVLVTQSQIKLSIQLNKQVISLNEVFIKPKKRDREADLKKFRDAFLGTSDNADKCQILNPEVIDIDYDEETRTLEASTSELLKISNNALGYRLNVLLNDLKVDYNTNAVTYQGKLFFEELRGEPLDIEAWKKNRMKTYTGSLRQFYRSLYQKTTITKGFEIHQATAKPNSIKKPDALITKKLQELNAAGANADRDSVRYWKMQLLLAPYIYTVDPAVLKPESIMSFTSTPGLYNLNFKDHLYLLSKQKETIHSNFLKFYTATMLKLNTDNVQFDHNGILINAADVTYEGAHVEKVADELPYDFAPDNE